jgi:hypothetical protein
MTPLGLAVQRKTELVMREDLSDGDRLRFELDALIRLRSRRPHRAGRGVIPVMGREAELFVAAEDMLVEVLGRIRGDSWRITVPPVLDTAGSAPGRLRAVVERHACDEATVPDLLAGRSPAPPVDDPLGADPQAAIVRLAGAACAAAREFGDRDGAVPTTAGDVPVADYLWQLTMARSFLAHDVAMALGSRACPLPEDLARGLLEGTAPRAGHWRAIGYFREPLPFPPGHVSWRDQFLLTAGRDPHPFLD